MVRSHFDHHGAYVFIRYGRELSNHKRLRAAVLELCCGRRSLLRVSPDSLGP
jgi:hypothetical protein